MTNKRIEYIGTDKVTALNHKINTAENKLKTERDGFPPDLNSTNKCKTIVLLDDPIFVS